MKPRRWLIRVALPPLVTLVVLTGLTELGVRVFDVSTLLLPPPSSVVEVGWERRADLIEGMWTTTLAAVSGFLASAVLGVLAAVVMSSSRLIERAFYPYAVLFQTVPVVAIAPVLVLGLGAGYRSVATSAFIVSLFPVIANTLTGLLSTDPALRDLFKLYGGGPVATLFKLKLPSATPNIITGLRIAAGLSVIGAIVGEFVAGEAEGAQGLGLIAIVGITRYNTELVYASIVFASVLGVAMFGAVNLLGWLLLRNWHASQQA